ncbi:MAG: glycoside hydrolase family 3 N-terminal domain-containing protein [Dysgonamonadaceae bacterium]|nr:glycoside hydrolase family 3 N-terminal domain-containing protein [Dysgonamonadaceae bacterium]MDD3901042.1 glycoside hydrolase family 3 N-terminal domain-containing protein [Dysgonamonadaceae bacterium]MDD4399260.1 glycoside hydrolase family 3 N-terminal domain-containing protein [Dysgonamonadaceae bacterium]MEA5080248.1 glycoside hydrolase family 3 N-terminal domain-containing protein [Dysgonamonadaceae bacterium]
MKKYSLLLLVVLGLVACNGSKNNASKNNLDATIEKRIDSVMSKMTLEEKVGQMAQFTVDVIGKGGNLYYSDEPFEIDQAMLDTVIGKYKVGSILNTSNNRARTTEVWEKTVKTIQDKAIEVTGIPVIYGIDAIHGATYTADATFFPQEIGMAATFNTDLMENGSRISAYETRSSNIPWVFSPTMDLGRDARWSRQWESFGEDAYLNAQMAVASVKGFQGADRNAVGNNNVAACLKHYLGYGVPVSGKDRTPAVISESDLREKFFEPFRAAVVQGGALSVMVNSGIINGVSTHTDHRLITEWLKDDLNFDGVVVTDWADVQNLLSRDHVGADYREVVKIAINAGVDMVMEPYNLAFCPTLLGLVNDGEISMERINDAVRRVLRLKFRLGLFDRPYWSRNDYPDFASKEHEAAAKTAADESITLLKNDNKILPFKQNPRILVTGPNANSMRTLDGGWSYSWQGEKVEEFAVKYNTIFEALQKKFGEKNVRYEPGVTYKMDGAYYEENEPQIQKAVVAAAGVDYIVLCVGENSYCETPGNLDELTLSKNQKELAMALQKTGKPVILVLNEGRPRLIREIELGSRAIIQTYLPGNFGADALADILAGDVNPSGRLPYTYPKYEQSLIAYDHKPSQNIEGKMEGAYDYGAETAVQYPFGFGLSYTTFEYSNLSVDKSTFASGDEMKVTVDVKNTGEMIGKEAVMLFSSDLVAALTPDVRRLRAFQKIELKPGESKTVTLNLLADDLAYVNELGKWFLEKGDFKLQVGNQITKITCTESKLWEKPNK